MQIPRVFVKVQERELTAVREFRLFTDFISLCHFQLSRAPFQYEIIGYRQYVKAVASFPKENRLHTEGLHPPRLGFVVDAFGSRSVIYC